MKNKKISNMDQFKKSDSPFKVPKGYFDSLEDRMDHIMDAERLKNMHSDKSKNEGYSALVDIIGKDPGFKVPKDYFESTDVEIPLKKEKKVIPLKKQFIRILSLAAAASILLFFGISNFNVKTEQKNKVEFQDEEFTSWIESDLIEFNSYEIAEAFNDVELNYSVYAEEDVDDYLNTLDIEHLILDNN